MNKRVYLSVPHMGENELRYVQEAFTSNWLSTVGPNLDAFEASFSERTGLPCVALGSGTAGMHLGLRLLGVGPDDEVICPSLTFIATINPAIYLGARPVFVDSERASWNIRGVAPSKNCACETLTVPLDPAVSAVPASKGPGRSNIVATRVRW